MKASIKLIADDLTGWELVERSMMMQIEARVTTPKAYHDHLSGADPRFPATIDSWNYFLAWKEQHPDRSVPIWISRIRNNDEHAAWAADGFKEFPTWYDEALVLGVHCSRLCGMPDFGPKDWEASEL